jgi:hypothetical protein
MRAHKLELADAKHVKQRRGIPNKLLHWEVIYDRSAISINSCLSVCYHWQVLSHVLPLAASEPLAEVPLTRIKEDGVCRWYVLGDVEQGGNGYLQ